MSAVARSEHVGPSGSDGAVGLTQRRIIRAEWTKLWSLRSTRWALLLAAVIMILAPVLFSSVQMSQWSTLSPHDRAHFDAIDVAASGHYLAQLAIGFLGVLTFTGEYATGMIQSSFMAVPRRVPLLWAKLTVFASVVFGLLLVASLVAFFVTQAIVSAHHVNRSLGSPHALRVVLATPLAITTVGMLSVGLGALLRSTAAGAAVLVLLMFVLTGVAALLPHSIADAVDPYLPINSAYTAATSTFDPGRHLSTWGGFAVFCAFTAVVIAIAAVRLGRGDA